ncbi:MAG: metalloregulator ArsR/SmtB family transcription factor [Chitinophagaceae bacterium]
MTGNTLVIRKDETSNDSIKLDYVAIKTAAMTLRAINHKLRQQIVRLLEEHKRMNVTDIYVKLRLEQSVASQHLAILRRANIVRTERDGKFIHYSLNHSRIANIAKFVEELVSSDDAPQTTRKAATTTEAPAPVSPAPAMGSNL